MSDKIESRKATQRFWKKLLVGSLICLVLFILVAWICLLRSVPIEISKETTYITGPLKSDGKQVDYFRAIELETYPPNMKTDENGFRRIVREIGVSKDSASEAWNVRQIYEKLGLDPSVKPTMTFEDPHEFLEAYVNRQVEESEQKEPEIAENIPEVQEMPEEDPYEKQQKLIENLARPWTLDEMPMMADWLKTNSPALDVVAEAVTCPSFAIPITRKNENEPMIAVLIPEVQRTRSFGCGLQARANHRIATGELDRAIDDILTCKTLGRRIPYNHGFMVNCLVGIAVEEIADEIGIAGSLGHQPTEAQLQRLLDIYTDTTGKKLPDRADPKKTLEYERYSALDGVQYIANERNTFFGEPLKCSDDPYLYLLLHSGIDWNIVMERVNYLYDHPETIRGLSTDPRSLKLLLPTQRSEFVGEMLAHIFVPATNLFFETIRRAECADRLKAITLAMLLYEKQHGTLPPAWTVGKDGKPLHSWRVLLLPYLGEEAKKLYAKIRLDEPWDSEHNRRFHKAVVPFYQCPSTELKPGETVYTVVLGKKTAFRGSEGVKLDTFGPHSANLILVTERKTPVCWINPTSEVPETDVTTEIGSKHEGVVPVGLRSGATVALPDEIIGGTYTFEGEENPDPTLFQKLLEGTAERIQ